MTRLPYTVTFICVQPARPAALAGVVAGINEEKELPLEITLHAFESSRLSDSANHHDVAAAIAASDLVLLSHIFLDEESAPLCRLVRESAPVGATVVAISSAAPVMRLTRIGKFRMGRGDGETAGRAGRRDDGMGETAGRRDGGSEESERDSLDELDELLATEEGSIVSGVSGRDVFEREDNGVSHQPLSSSRRPAVSPSPPPPLSSSVFSARAISRPI